MNVVAWYLQHIKFAKTGRALLRQLVADYGVSLKYTPKQIDMAATKVGLNKSHLIFAHASLLSFHDFSNLYKNRWERRSYANFRSEFFGHVMRRKNIAPADGNDTTMAATGCWPWSASVPSSHQIGCGGHDSSACDFGHIGGF
jgi:hypothetical protein